MAITKEMLLGEILRTKPEAAEVLMQMELCIIHKTSSFLVIFLVELSLIK